MSTENEGPTTLLKFIKEHGAMACLRNDNSKMQTSRTWDDICNQYLISTETTEPHHPHQNPSEHRIGTVKGKVNGIMDMTGAPSKLWFYCTCLVVDILNLTADKALNWRTPLERAFGFTPDISPFVHFKFFEPVYYLDDDSFPASKESLGYWLGVTRNCGDAFTYYVWKPSTNQVLARSILRSALTSIKSTKNLRADMIL